jgi:predicted DNA-binding transcriptional regulator YafY
MNAHLETLLMIKTLSEYGDCSAATLQTMGKISPATLKRYIADARHLGANIVSIRSPAGVAYSLLNKAMVQPRLASWIELEQTRDLRESRFRE